MGMKELDKIIKGMELCLTPYDRREGDDVDICPYVECPYFREYNMGDYIRALCGDALALLKAQEPIEVRLHLCESCKKQYPDCEATKEGIVFGNGIGNDNIIGCSAYVNRWMSRNEPRVLTIEEVRALKHNDVVWLEDKDKQDVIPGIVRGQYVHSKTTMTYTSFKVDFGHPVLGFGYYYMIRWRCLKSLPTKNQRKAEKWL